MNCHSEYKVGHYVIKTDSIRYYLLPNSLALKLCNQKKKITAWSLNILETLMNLNMCKYSFIEEFHNFSKKIFFFRWLFRCYLAKKKKEKDYWLVSLDYTAITPVTASDLRDTIRKQEALFSGNFLMGMAHRSWLIIKKNAQSIVVMGWNSVL